MCVAVLVVRFTPQTNRERKGASQSTKSAFENVMACARKGCFTMSAVDTSYIADKIGAKTHLAHVKKLEGTGANEAAHRYRPPVPGGARGSQYSWL